MRRRRLVQRWLASFFFKKKTSWNYIFTPIWGVFFSSSILVQLVRNSNSSQKCLLRVVLVSLQFNATSSDSLKEKKKNKIKINKWGPRDWKFLISCSEGSSCMSIGMDFYMNFFTALVFFSPCLLLFKLRKRKPKFLKVIQTLKETGLKKSLHY